MLKYENQFLFCLPHVFMNINSSSGEKGYDFKHHTLTRVAAKQYAAPLNKKEEIGCGCHWYLMRVLKRFFE